MKKAMIGINYSDDNKNIEVWIDFHRNQFSIHNSVANHCQKCDRVINRIQLKCGNDNIISIEVWIDYLRKLPVEKSHRVMNRIQQKSDEFLLITLWVFPLGLFLFTILPIGLMLPPIAKSAR